MDDDIRIPSSTRDTTTITTIETSRASAVSAADPSHLPAETVSSDVNGNGNVNANVNANSASNTIVDNHNHRDVNNTTTDTTTTSTTSATTTSTTTTATTPFNNRTTRANGRRIISNHNDNDNNHNRHNHRMMEEEQEQQDESTLSNDLSKQSLTWSIVNPVGTIQPPPRSGAASVVVRDRLYMFGGYGGGTGRLDDFYSFEFEKNQWEEVEVLSIEKPGCRENNGVVIGDSSRVYLFGGYNGNAWLNDLWMFDIDTKRWTCIQENSDTNDGNANTNTNTNIRRNNTGTNTNTNSLEDEDRRNVDTDTDTDAAGHNHNHTTTTTTTTIHDDPIHFRNHPNTQVVGTVPSRRFGYVSVVHNHKLILFGGFDGSKWLNDMYEFDFHTKIWRQIAPPLGQLPSVRSCPAWAKDDTHVYIQGGYDGVTRKSDFFSCDLATYRWTQMPSAGTPPSPRYFHSCSIYGSKLYVYGGYSGSLRLADMYAYDFETRVWSQINCGSSHDNINNNNNNGGGGSNTRPSGRSSLVAQVHRNHLYIFGGYNGETVLNDFYKFRLTPVSIPPPNLVQDLRSLMNREEFSDVAFLIGDQLFYANRALLAVRSEYFKTMLFTGGMKESLPIPPNSSSFISTSDNHHDQNTIRSHTQSKSTHNTLTTHTPTRRNKMIIPIEDISPRVFEKVLEFLYTDTIQTVSLDIGIPLLIISERFMLDRLKALCEDRIRTYITKHNVMDIFIASHTHRAFGLKDIALDLILQNLQHPTIQQGLLELKSEPDLLIDIIRQSSVIQSKLSSSNDTTHPRRGPFGSGSEWNGTRR